VARVLAQAVREAAGKVRHDNRDYRHFQRYQAYVDYVIGEFPWRVTLDEAVQVDDYVAPPFMLSKERSDTEVTWTLGEYLAPEEIQAAFQLKTPLRRPQGVYANQPNPRAETHRRVCRRFWQFAGLALVIHLLLMLVGPGGKVLTQPLVFTPDDDEPRLTSEFVLKDKTNRLALIHDTSLDNNWVGLTATLVNQDTGENWTASREVSHYSGVEDGDSWSEGSANDEVVFTDLPPGHYRVAIESDMDAGSRPVNDRLTVARAGPHWSSLALLLVFLAIFPIVTRIRQGGFEVKRWAESDHPIVTASSSGGEDDD
jgi:hypothetical protein